MKTDFNITQYQKVVFKKSIVFCGLLSLSLAGSYFYRPWIYGNHYLDFHLADVFPSLFSVPVFYSLYDLIYTVAKRPQKSRIIVVTYSTIGFIIYELLELFVGGFDYYDCIAILVGGVLTLLF